MTTSKRGPSRPLSPHLGNWRWSATMATSIFHRVTGVGNSIGVLLLTWWLVAVANGRQGYIDFSAFVTSPFGRFLLFGFTVSLCYHLLNGIRHLFWDAGHGFDLATASRWSWFGIIGSVVLASGIWAMGYFMMGAL